MSVTILKLQLARLKPIQILYRSYENFRDEYFLNDLNQNFERDLFQLDLTSLASNKIYNLFIEIVTSTLDKHATIKSQTIRGNRASFMNKELSKAIMHRSWLKSKYRKFPTPNNRLNYQKQRNKCVAIRRKAVNEQFSRISGISGISGKVSNKDFYKLVKPYLANKGTLTNNDITLVNDDIMVTDQNKIMKILNDYYVNIVQITTGVVPSNIKDGIGSHLSNEELVAKIVDQYKDHPSIKSMKENCEIDCTFSFQEVSSDDVFRHLNNDPKTIGDDNIPPKILNLTAGVLYSPLTVTINSSINEITFPDKAKRAAVTPIFKSEEKTDKKNYRPVSILNSLSKVLENVMKEQLIPFFRKLFVCLYLSL